MPTAEHSRAEDRYFESEVLRIARQLWPAAQFSGPTVVEGRERDGIFETEECIHLLEVTTSRTKDKAVKDIGKLVALAAREQRRPSGKAVRCWFVTRDEPLVEQRKIAEKHRPLVTALSFAQFQSLLIDTRSYLSARDNYYFGSVRDPATGAKTPSIEFIEVMLSRVGGEEVASPRDLLRNVQAGQRIVILGDYGAGKSMVLRHLYQGLQATHLKGETRQFPVFVNLRDHYGQSEPAELLERHARSIGFARPSHLVRAWRAGYVHLLLDGFDEITTLSIQGLWTKLRDNRYRAMEVVRRLCREHPEGAGIAIAGRAHFFDSPRERRNALGLVGSTAEFSLNEFTDEQVAEYLKRGGLVGVVPLWLPSRPLLVAYLGARGLLSELAMGQEREPASGWHLLLDHIASRESEIEAGIDGGTVRKILERLATKARATSAGLGPLSPDALISAFSEVCGYAPDERGMVLLQRLPGLGVDREEEGTRAFIDEDFADACRAGDLMNFTEAPFAFDASSIAQIECASGALGIAVAALRARQLRYSSGKANAAIRRACELSSPSFTADLVRMTIEAGQAVEDHVVIRGVYIPECEFTAKSGNASRVEFQECFFGRVGIDADVDETTLPHFHGCFVGEVDGRVSLEDLPRTVFDAESIVESFTATATTTDAVLSLELPMGTKVVITILKKLYQRRGAGRRENALFRGLDHRARRLVPGALHLILREGLAGVAKRGDDTIWLPDRSKMRRVGRIVAAPSTCNDPLIAAAELLEE